jgi:hypothetical protein
MKIESTHKPAPVETPKQAPVKPQPKVEAAAKPVAQNPAHLGKAIDTKA